MTALCQEAVLKNGFRIAAERHEVTGGTIRLYSSGGVIEIPADTFASFESAEPVAAGIEVKHEAVPQQPATPQALPPSAQEVIERAALKHGLPPAFLHSVARVESGYRQQAVSRKGAIGVMQLMPATAAALGADPNDLEQNIDAGARHLRDLLIRYEGGMFRALAAYNAGVGAVERYGGIPPYRETLQYVERVFRLYRQLGGSTD